MQPGQPSFLPMPLPSISPVLWGLPKYFLHGRTHGDISTDSGTVCISPLHAVKGRQLPGFRLLTSPHTRKFHRCLPTSQV